MTDIERGRGARRGIHLCAIAALGLALSGCGGSSASASAPATAMSSTPASTPTASSTPSTATSAGASTAAANPLAAASNPPTASIANVTLNWAPPTENTDGTPLTNLAGYDIHYGTASGQYTQTISIENPGIATYVVSNLSPGTYYFSVTAVNSQGAESPLSSEVSTTVD